MEGTPLIREELPVTPQAVMRHLVLLSDPRIECVTTSIEGGHIVHTYEDPRFPNHLKKHNAERVGSVINIII